MSDVDATTIVTSTGQCGDLLQPDVTYAYTVHRSTRIQRVICDIEAVYPWGPIAVEIGLT